MYTYLVKFVAFTAACPPTLELAPPTLVADARARASLSNRNARLRDIFYLRVLSPQLSSAFFSRSFLSPGRKRKREGKGERERPRDTLNKETKRKRELLRAALSRRRRRDDDERGKMIFA
jgi:hypothetical protein